MEECRMWPTTLLRLELLEKLPWPQSCPRTKSAQNMVPCAVQYSGHMSQLSRRDRH
jgi:hypothetical protein